MRLWEWTQYTWRSGNRIPMSTSTVSSLWPVGYIFAWVHRATWVLLTANRWAFVFLFLWVMVKSHKYVFLRLPEYYTCIYSSNLRPCFHRWSNILQELLLPNMIVILDSICDFDFKSVLFLKYIMLVSICVSLFLETYPCWTYF